MDGYGNRRKGDFLLAAGELVGGDALDFFGRERWRHLLDGAEEAGSGFPHLLFRNFSQCICTRLSLQFGSGGFAFGVVGVGGKAEPYDSFVLLFRAEVKLGETGEISNDQWEHAGGCWIKRAEMSDGAQAENAANSVDDVVRGHAGGLVDDKDLIHANRIHAVFIVGLGWRCGQLVCEDF